MWSNKDIDSWLTSIEQEVKDKARQAVSRIANEMTQEAEFQILKFYSSYSPSMYKNQFGLRGSYKRYYRNPHNTIYYGGVELQPSSGSYRANYLPGHPSISSEYISDLAYEGRHGATEQFPKWVLSHINTIPPVMSPSPKDALEKKIKDIEGNIDKYFD